jgi:BASS family bile acid:Na+ symporter
MTLDQATNLLVTVTLVEMMAALGLTVTLAELAGVARDWRLLTRAGLANYVIVPAATVGLLLLFEAEPMVAVGFLVLAACPGAPFGPPITALARGDVPAAVGLMVLLAGSSAVLAPLLLAGLLPVVAGAKSPQVDAGRIATTLLLTQLGPLAAGIGLRHWRPLLAGWLQGPARWLSTILNLAVVGLILVAHYPLFLALRAPHLAGMLALLLASWAAGGLLAGPAAGVRKALTLTTGLRNVGVGLVIVTGAFPGTAALTATVVYGLLGVVGTLLLGWWWGRRPP